MYLTGTNDGGVTHVGDDFAFGSSSVAAKVYNDNIDVWAGDHKLLFGGLTAGEPNTTLRLRDDDPNTLTLFAQSQGFDQLLVHANDFDYLGGVSFSVSTENPSLDNNIFEQFLEQNREKVAIARYIIGTRAQNLGVIDGRDFSSDHDAGMRWDNQNIYTATVLSEVQLLNGKTITLNVPGAQNWGAHLTGEGSVSYVGDNKAEDVVTIKQLFESNYNGKESVEEADEKDRLNRPNDYTGATTVKNVTLNLERETSLGNSGILTATDANIVEVKAGALGALNTVDFTNTALTTAGTSLEVTGEAIFAGVNTLRSLSAETADFGAGSLVLNGADLTASSVNVIGKATATGTNTLHVTDKVTVGGKTEITLGSLSTDSAAFESGSLVLGNANLTASSVAVTGGSTVSGRNTVTTDHFTTHGLSLNENGTLDVTGDLTATSVNLSAGTQLSVGKNATVNAAADGQLTMQGGSIAANRLDVLGTLTLSGENTISTADGASILGGDVVLVNGVSLDVTQGGLTAGTNVTVDADAELTVTGELSVAKTLTLGTAGSRTNTSNFSVNKLKVGEELAFVGNGCSSDKVYTFGTLVSALNPGSAYDVSLNNANVEYTSRLDGVGTTTLDQAHLTLAYDNYVSLGRVVMTNTSGSAKSQNLLTFKSDWGFMIDNRISVEGSATEDVIELSGKGEVVFADNVQVDDKYAGWIRMTGTTLNLPLPNMQNSTDNLSISVGEGGTIAVSDGQQINLKRLGWAETSTSGRGGTLDLSKFDFSNLQNNEAAITVKDLTVNGNGTIVLDESAVQGLTVGTGGGSIFDALNGDDATLVISVTNGFDPEAVGGTINVDIEGDSNDDKKLTGYFGSSGLFTGDDATGAAAKGTWGYGTVFNESGLSVTHGLTEIELLDGQTLGLAVDGAKYQGVGAKLTGTGTLKKTGDGYLHLVNTENTWTGSTVVEGGRLVAEAGALGTGALSVSTDGTFVLSGAQDVEADQVVQELAVDGIVKIGGDTTKNRLTLEVANGGYFAEGSTLEGRADSLLALTGGTLTVTDIEDVAKDFLGDIQVDEGATLVLKGNKDGTDADLSNVTGAGTIELKDKACYGTQGGFTGLTVVNGGWLTIDEKADTGTSGNRASLAMSSGTVDSTGGSHEFKSIKLTGGQLNFGTFMPGSDATGVLIATDELELSNLTVTADKGAFDSNIPAESLMKIDNATGATSWLVRMADGASGTLRIDEDSVDINIKTGKWTSNILQDGTDIGDITYESGAVIDNSKGIGVNYHATEMSLEGVLELAGSDVENADSTLDLEITGTETGGILVTDKKVTLAQKGSYGTLSVANGATVSVNGTQTLAQGGDILGTVETADGAELLVTGDTLTIGGNAGTNFAVALNAKDVDKGATLRFEGRKGTADGQLFEGKLTTEAGSRIEFSDTNGNFSFDRGNVAYSLENSSITFGPAAGKDFRAGSVAVNNASTAYFDLTGKAEGEVDLSGVTGNGKVSLNYETEGGELVLSDSKKIDGFTGTLAFANATATIGTDVSVKDSALNVFATSTGSIEVGEGSVLRINNEKKPGSDGTYVPQVVGLNGDLTISDRATLDFTAGIFGGGDNGDNGDKSDGYFGNKSGKSVNAIDMQGHGLNVLGTDADHKVTVIANVDNLDFSSGLPSNGTYTGGSILDMLGDTPDYPVLTLIENIGEASDLEKIAAEMKLEGDNVSHEVEFWQKNWGADTEVPKLVAKVTTGVTLVADEAHNGIAIGAGITGIDIVSGATLRMDEAAATESGVHEVGASISGDGRVVVSNSLGTPGKDGITFKAANTYTGETVIDLGATLTATNKDAFAGSSLVRVGTMTTGDASDPAPSTLKVDVGAGDALTVNALTVGENGTVELAMAAVSS